MYKAVVFAGTTEGCEISIFLAGHKVKVLACVATEYGSKSLNENEYLKIHAGRLDEKEMEELLRKAAPSLVLDATLSYSAIAEKNHIQAFPTDPKISIFSLTVALIASNPGARSLRGSYPLPC